MEKESENKPKKTVYNLEDLVDKDIPDVYGPPEWYDTRGNLDDNHPSARRFKERIREIEERNKQRQMLRESLEQGMDKPMETLYGPMPPMEPTVPMELTTVPEPRREKEKEKIEDDKEKKDGFFARLFGKKRKK